jgi:hypothetical protein
MRQGNSTRKIARNIGGVRNISADSPNAGYVVGVKALMVAGTWLPSSVMAKLLD